MTTLTEVGALHNPNGVPCVLGVIRGLLSYHTPLELFTVHGWKRLVQARVVIDGVTTGGTCYLTTSDQAVYQARPDDLIRVRFPRTRKAGEHTP